MKSNQIHSISKMKFRNFSYICILIVIGNLFTSFSVSAIGYEWDMICTVLKSKAMKNGCIRADEAQSKCQFGLLTIPVCKNEIKVSEQKKPKAQFASDYDTRIEVSEIDKKKSILRYRKDNEAVSYAWNEWKDLDFILMIQEESLWEEFIFWDNGTSIWYCQISKIHWKELYEAYVKAKDWKERITICHDHYLRFSQNVGAAFHGWKTRMRNLPSFTFK